MMGSLAFQEGLCLQRFDPYGVIVIYERNGKATKELQLVTRNS